MLRKQCPRPAVLPKWNASSSLGRIFPSAEEVGPNPVDTYRPGDMEKLGVRNATDFLTNLPQEMGTTVNQNSFVGGDGAVIPNLRGLLPKETLVLDRWKTRCHRRVWRCSQCR